MYKNVATRATYKFIYETKGHGSEVLGSISSQRVHCSDTSVVNCDEVDQNKGYSQNQHHTHLELNGKILFHDTGKRMPM